MITRRTAVTLFSAALTATAVGVQPRVPVLSASQATPEPSPNQDDTLWPMRDGNAARTRVMPGTGPSFDQNVGELWRWSADASVDIGIPPIVSQWTIYYTTGSSSGLIAQDLATGAEHWRALQGRGFNGQVTDGTVLYLVVESETIMALNATSGTSVWTTSLPQLIGSSLTIDAGTLYVCADSGELFALDAATGMERWRYPVGQSPFSVPVVGDSMVFVASLSGPLLALDTETGLEAWQLPPASPTDAITPGHGVFADHTLYFSDSTGVIRALDAASGELRWQTPADDSFAVSAAAGGQLFAIESESMESRRICALDASTGLTQWATEPYMSPDVSGISGDTLLVQVMGGRQEQWYVQGLDTRTGTIGWRLDTYYRSYGPVAAGPYLIMYGLSGTVYGN